MMHPRRLSRAEMTILPVEMPEGGFYHDRPARNCSAVPSVRRMANSRLVSKAFSGKEPAMGATGGKRAEKLRKWRIKARNSKRTIFSALATMLVLGGISAASVFYGTQKVASEITFLNPKSLQELLALSPEQLGRVDLARINLLCAEGLPGAEKMDVNTCLAELDRYASISKEQIEKYLPMFQRNPARFGNIEGFYRMQMLVTVLKRDLKLDYNPARQNDEPWNVFYSDSRDLLLNGLLAQPHLGTCASLPVVVTAVAQKLGYPVRLVTTKGHMFCRWEDSTGRFNIECTNGGMVSHPDKYYTEGVFAADNPIYAQEQFLQNMTPAQCLAAFLDTRGLCLKANQRYAESVTAYQQAVKWNPESRLLAAKLDIANKQLQKYASTIK